MSMPLYGAKLDHSLPRQIFNLLVNPSLQVVTAPQSTSSETSSSSRAVVVVIVVLEARAFQVYQVLVRYLPFHICLLRMKILLQIPLQDLTD